MHLYLLFIISNFSLLSIFENAILKNVPNIIGKAKVQNISALFLKRVFKEYLKLCININHEVPFLLILGIHH